MTALACIVVALGAAWIVIAPLVLRLKAPLSDGPDRLSELRELQALRDVAYETLRDIEFDYHAGKIDEADYRELTARYQDEALQLMRRMDLLSAAPAGTAPPAGVATPSGAPR